mmetsp:Transcript_14832/g.20792  ORF Transcript_14832/g.20792 Transcript_14832/m.20792 type:complete len:210 (+) Transcript_14832:326-955(+)|eukprot:CAMPEP_0184505476 /NCGR_PEP_ID=MMETSP0113_2-20130426/53004_1 /TAXON_ID=91329 /ORGANISM="Norrisiella sphaerica, Strain BC52" /LENGTH=209 /DNA_ID=CAMNT_0026895165 /DNA_START=394 /DNA_END=1023 /DNA_ORIENTATION=+
MTLPNLPKCGRRKVRRFLASGGAETDVISHLERDVRYNFLKTRQPQFARFSKALSDLLEHYAKTMRAYINAQEGHAQQDTDKFDQKVNSCMKTYETAIEQLLEKAYLEAKEEAITTRIAASTREPAIRFNSRTAGGCEQGKRLNFKREQVYHLSKWFEEHVDDPYPSPSTKFELARQSGLSFKQVSNWFINARSRRLSSKDKKKLKRTY